MTTSTKAPAKPRFGTLNEHLVCSLCRGYLVDATTITECLHSFCRSCIVQYIQGSSFCPRCEVQLHKGSPLRSLKPDKGLQDIVFKLVPNLFHNEMQRRRVYYDAHPQYADQTTPEQRGDCLERFYSPDDSISLSLEYHDRRKGKGGDDKPLPPKRYLKCPALFTVGLLKKFVRLKFDLPREIMIDVFQRRESLADEYTLLDIAYIYPWKRSEPMRFFYCLRDPRVPESDEEREMPSLCAAVTARATRASRRASSASSLASPLASPRGSPVPRVKTESPPPAKLTSQPPAGTPQPKPLAKPVPTSPPKACSPAGPKITLTISPSRGTVTSTTTELPPRPDSIAAPLKSPTSTTAPAPKPAAAPTPKPATPTAATPVSVTPAPASTATPATATTAAPAAATPSTATAAPAAPSAPSPKKTATPVAAAAPKPAGTPSASKNFPATITTRTPNGGFITVKNPIARPPNGMSVGAKMVSPPPKSPVGPVGPGTPVGAVAAPKPVSSTPKAAPAAVATPKQVGVKTKRHSNGLPVLAPKDPKLSTTTLSPIVALQQMAHINKMAEAIKSPAVAASNARPSAPAAAPAKGPPSADDEKNKVETAKAILQLSMGFKRSDTPTDSMLNNRIDNIVKGLQDDESNDGTLVIKSEPASPEPPAESASPRHSPVPPVAAVTIPKVNGLTITPIEPGKRKASPSQAGGLEEKRIKMHDALPATAKRPGDAAHASPGPAKMAKVDKIADSIKQKQEQQRQQAAKRPPTPKPATVKPAAASPVMGPAKPPVPAPSTFKTFPPAQIKPVMPQAVKPSPQHAAKPQPSLQPRPAAKPLPPLQPKPAVMAPLTPRPQHPAAPVAAQPHLLAKPGAAQQQGNQAKPTAGQANNHAKPGLPQQNTQAKPGPGQQNQPRPGPPQQNNPSRPGAAPQNGQGKPGTAQQNNQAKPGPGQQNAQPKPGGANPQGQTAGANQQPAKPAPMQPAKPANAQQPQNAATQPSKPAAVQPPKQSPNNQLNKKSPESPVKNKKPIPDLQRLQRPLSGTTVNGSLSLAEVKEQLAKKGHYSPPPPQQQQQQPNRTPPRLIEISQQRKSAPPAPAAGHRDYGALDLTAASPRADHGGSWTPPANFAQSLAKRQQQLLPHVLRPPPSSLSSASPSPPADSPGSATTSVSPELFMDQNMMAQQVQAHALLQQIQLQSLLQAQASMQPRFPAGLKKAIEDWGVKATATAKRK